MSVLLFSDLSIVSHSIVRSGTWTQSKVRRLFWSPCNRPLVATQFQLLPSNRLHMLWHCPIIRGYVFVRECCKLSAPLLLFRCIMLSHILWVLISSQNIYCTSPYLNSHFLGNTFRRTLAFPQINRKSMQVSKRRFISCNILWFLMHCTLTVMVNLF